MSYNSEDSSSQSRLGRIVEDFLTDLRHSLRVFVKNPMFTLLVVLCLGLGIGANSAIFSIANTLLLRPLPAESPDQLVAINRGPGMAPPSSYPDYVDFRNNNKSLSGLVAVTTTPVSFGDGSQSEVIMGEMVTGNYFSVLGVQPVIGRAFAPEEDQTPGTHPVVVLSHRFWERRFNSDPGMIGKTIILNGQSFNVIGVGPADFKGVSVMLTPDVWVPMQMQAQLIPSHPDWLKNRNVEWLTLLGRLNPGVSLEQAQNELNIIDRHLEESRANTSQAPAGSRVLVLSHPTGIYIPHLRRMISVLTAFLMVLVGLVLLIACANVTNLLLARATARQREIAMRRALGASRGRLIRQMLTESMVLALLGGIAGLLLARWFIGLLSGFRPPIPPPFTYTLDLHIDSRVLVFALVLSLVTAIIFGLVPALRASKPDLVSSLKDESFLVASISRRFNLRNLIVVSQVAVSLMLLISAAIFVRSLQKVQTVDPGFNTENAFLMSVDLDLQGYDHQRGRHFYRQLKERLKAIPGVQSVSSVNYFPLGYGNMEEAVVIEGTEPPPDGSPLFVPTYIVDPEFFQTMGIPLLRGRNFTEQDREGTSGVAIVNERFASRFWPNEDAVGKYFRTEGPQGPLLEVIGVAKSIKYSSLGEAPRSVIHISQNQEYTPVMNILVRTAVAPGNVMGEAQRQVQLLDQNLPVKSIMTFDQALDSSLWMERIGASLLGLFGILGLVLSTAGVYGVIAYSVVRRTHEIGIRMALGAKPGDIIKLIVKQGALLVLVGIVIGLVLAFLVSRLLASFLYGVSIADPVPFLGVPAFILLIAILACYVVARRAAKLSPLVALRVD